MLCFVRVFILTKKRVLVRRHAKQHSDMVVPTRISEGCFRLVLNARLDVVDHDVRAARSDALGQARSGPGREQLEVALAAVVESCLSVVKAWLDSGHHPDDMDNHGMTLLSSAAYYGVCTVARLILSRGAIVDFPAQPTAPQSGLNGWTPLMFAVQRGRDNDRADVIRLLVAAGADVNARDGTGNSVLMKAGCHGIAAPSLGHQNVLLLLRCGATIDLRDSEGETAETLAVFWRSPAQFLFADMRLAGGFKKYLRQPTIELNLLRVLCQRGRATRRVGPAVIARLFPEPRALLGPQLPRELFAYVLSFWRSARALDSGEDRPGDKQRLLDLRAAFFRGENR